MSARKVAQAVKQLCVVTIGYQTLIVPASKGMALVELLQHSVTAEPKFSGLRDTYTVGQQPRVELALIKPEQLEAPAPTTVPRRPLQLEG